MPNPRARAYAVLVVAIVLPGDASSFERAEAVDTLHRKLDPSAPLPCVECWPFDCDCVNGGDNTVPCGKCGDPSILVSADGLIGYCGAHA